MKFRVLFLVASLLLVADVAFGATITVRKDGTGNFTVIQQALDVAAAGDTVLIGPGEFLEHSTVRLPGSSVDIESYANVTVDNLTIIGAGADQTLVGPAVYSGVYGTFTPKCMTYVNRGDIRISDLCLRNCWDGLYMCVFRLKSATDSDAIRPPIPIQIGHPFRSKPATDSDAIRPPLAG